MSGETKSKKKYEIDMCNGAILPKLLAFTLPLMCSSVLQLLFNAADIIVVGNFAGDTALAAVGSNTALINLLTNFFLGLSIGANVLVARFYGAKAEEDVSDTVHTAMLLSVFSGIILTVIGCIGARQILIWMQTPEDVLPLATTYLRIYFIGMTSMMVYNFGSAILRAVGDTKRPLYYLSAAGVINIGLNLLFVIVFRMSVAGVALATGISETICQSGHPLYDEGEGQYPSDAIKASHSSEAVCRDSADRTPGESAGRDFCDIKCHDPVVRQFFWIDGRCREFCG